MAINTRPTPYYPQVFERKFKVAVDIFYGWFKNSEWQTKVSRGQAEWTVVPSNLGILNKRLFINSYMPEVKEWAVPTKQECSSNNSSSEMHLKLWWTTLRSWHQAKSTAAALRNLLKCCYLRLNSSCIFGGAKATTLNKILAFLKKNVLLFSPLLTHPASTDRDWRSLLHIPPTHY